MKIALATQDCTRVDAHFGWAAHFMLYDVTPDGARFLRLVRFRGPLAADGDASKLAPKLRALRGCRLVLASAVGLEARAHLRRMDVEPVTALAGAPVDAALGALRDTLRRRPPPWLRRALQSERRRPPP
ncbi:NifB/NifX family molybdenum-iron cluster-binding protein [Caenispirillum bisanense]|uniref:Nitrogen fixation protein NifX n=1 Tax=Caenispirillum bisanense TaxID=414052 RepID=A0A286GIE3_9PROT|nr:NifB/NifX family molybdenum-iron cluster-binding protein [Caenispirillum bisanense]SOD95305.1 nitrogen fixation protein NifX [Caenispirillum bisanense]